MSRRLKRLQQDLRHEAIDACLIENSVDLYYFTGVDVSCGKLWVCERISAFFVDARYIEVATKHSAIETVILLSPSAEDRFLQTLKMDKVALDSSFTTVAKGIEIEKRLKKLEKPPKVIWKENLTAHIRLIKGVTEIEQIKNSIKILKKGYHHLLTKLKEGITEKELAIEFEIFLRRQGAHSSAFDPIIAFGKNAAMPHYRAGSSKLKKNQLVLMDLGVSANHYKSDMTRFVFHGVPDPILMRLSLTVRKAHKAAVALCMPGNTLGQLDDAARGEMKKLGLEEYYTHSLGHGIGLDTHEFPRVRFDGADKDLVLQPGMVITIEPGLYLPGKGGVRWEDMILITPKGHDNLTQSI